MINLISLSTAGGGKTTKLIKRINDLVEKGANINKILVISFTKSSCNDILKRSGIMAHTIHSFCYSYLPGHYNIEENAGKFTEIFLNNFLELSKLGIDKVNRLVESYFINRKYMENIDFLSEGDQLINEEFKSLIEKIIIEKNSHNCIFFSEIIALFSESMDEYLLDIYSQYDHILIDEAQDLSFSQLKIIYALIENIFLEENKTFFIVGDIKQSIYDFQGSAPIFYKNFLENVMTLCKRSNIKYILEDNNETYRFGGEILDLVNRKFALHISHKKEGFYNYISCKSSEEILEEVEFLVNYYLEIYPPSEIMILYNKTSSLVEKIQNKIGKLGYDIKIYTRQNKVTEALRDILGYIETQDNWFAAKILQGPFFHLLEPHFYLLAKNSDDLTSYNSDFFKFLIENQHNAYEILLKLSARTCHLDFLDTKVLAYLLSLSRGTSSFADLVLNIPECIKCIFDGIKFSTVHSSKGLEAEVVIYLPNISKEVNTYVLLENFVILKDNINDITNNLIINSNEQKNLTKFNLEYVAFTRAKKHLYQFNLSKI
jgi:ATP-dependent exoDNAse (exonuclease V) beta subunit